MIRPWTTWLICLSGAVLMTADFARAAQPEANLALGKKYTLAPAPNYPLCTDELDAVDLTDGKRATPSGGAGMWGDKATVGWQHIRGPITITVDLERVVPIGGVSVASAAGSSGVTYPASILIQVSEDGSAFFTVGELMRVAESPWPALYNEYSEHVFRSTQLQASGRYLRLVVIPSGIFAFFDEIEVLRGADDASAIPSERQPSSDAEAVDPQRLTELGIVKRIRWDISLLKTLIEKQGRAENKDLLAELDRLDEEAMTHEPAVDVKHYRAVLPVDDLHRRVLAVHGRLLAAQELAPLTVWHTPPYQMLETFQTPTAAPKELRVRMMLNERRATVFNITNASPERRVTEFQIEGLPSDKDPQLLTVYQVEAVDTREGHPAANALVPLTARDGRYSTEVPAGMTRQIWLSFQPRQISPGLHAAKIVVSGQDLSETLPLSLEVAATRMPDDLHCSSTYWDYVANDVYDITPENRQAAIDEMRRQRVTSAWSNPNSLPYPKPADLDAEGNLIGKIDYTEWDKYVKLLPEMRHYMIFAHKPAGANFAGLEQGTPAFDRAVAAWARDWADHNRQIGLRPGQAILLILDEPSAADHFQTTYLWAKAFNAGTDEILIFIDPVGTSAHEVEFARESLAESDIICPNEPQYVSGPPELREFYQQFREQGKTLWLYTCGGPTRMFNPSYFRLQPWRAFIAGAEGSGFWAFGDAGGATSWNEYLAVGGQSFTPIYLGRDSVHSSKHWEAALEGLQDYEYFVLLRNRMNELKKAGDTRGATRLRAMLESLPQSTVARIHERHGEFFNQEWKDTSAEIDEARLQILDVLTETPK